MLINYKRLSKKGLFVYRSMWAIMGVYPRLSLISIIESRTLAVRIVGSSSNMYFHPLIARESKAVQVEIELKKKTSHPGSMAGWSLSLIACNKAEYFEAKTALKSEIFIDIG